MEVQASRGFESHPLRLYLTIYILQVAHFRRSVRFDRDPRTFSLSLGISGQLKWPRIAPHFAECLWLRYRRGTGGNQAGIRGSISRSCCACRDQSGSGAYSVACKPERRISLCRRHACLIASMVCFLGSRLQRITTSAPSGERSILLMSSYAREHARLRLRLERR